MNEQTSVTEPAWEPTPPGQLDQLSRELRGARQKRRTRRFAVGAALFLVVLFAVDQTLLSKAPLGCDATRSHAEAYASDSLDARTKERVDNHLATCPECRRFYHDVRAAGAT